MANYIVSEKLKRVLVSAELTPIEQQIIYIYIKSGYSVVEKNTNKSLRNTGVKISRTDIEKWFKNKKDTKGLTEFNKKIDEKMIDKKGNLRKGGYLVALKWFKDNYKEGYNEILAEKTQTEDITEPEK